MEVDCKCLDTESSHEKGMYQSSIVAVSGHGPYRPTNRKLSVSQSSLVPYFLGTLSRFLLKVFTKVNSRDNLTPVYQR